jgi:hypothetical protein
MKLPALLTNIINLRKNLALAKHCNLFSSAGINVIKLFLSRTVGENKLECLSKNLITIRQKRFTVQALLDVGEIGIRIFE